MAILRGTQDTITVNVQTKITEDLGKVHNLKFKAKFKRRDYDDAKKLIESMLDPDTDVTEATIIRDDLLDWSDLQGEGGEVPFDDETVEVALQHPEYRDALFRAWSQAQLRRLMANAKN